MGKDPDYIGHRKRLRERFLKVGPDGLADYELLELMLFGAQPRRDVKPMAKALLERFGSFAEVISAEPQAMTEVAGVGECAVIALKSAQSAALRLIGGQVMGRPVLSNWQALLDYCQASMAFAKIEQFRIFYLNNRNVLIADEVQ